MKGDAVIFIDHILECIELIEKYTKDCTKGDFLNDIQLQDSIIRRIEIIGEAVKKHSTRNKKEISRDTLERNRRNERHPCP